MIAHIILIMERPLQLTIRDLYNKSNLFGPINFNLSLEEEHLKKKTFDWTFGFFFLKLIIHYLISLL